MIPKECKRLAEVDFPISQVSIFSAGDKYIRSKPNTALHTWWAQRPLSACRGILLGLLLPDPCDNNCPDYFRNRARELLHGVVIIGKTKEDLRRALIKYIGIISSWDNARNRQLIELGRKLVAAAYSDEVPLVADPFSGSGAIPLEGIRLSCDVFASDLNPVACLLSQMVLELVPRHGQDLADSVLTVGKKFQEEVAEDVKEFYPSADTTEKPIAYIWARTVVCESPNCGAEIPLITSPWLCQKGNKKILLQYSIKNRKDAPPELEFEIVKVGQKRENKIPPPTTKRAKAFCPCCQTVMTPDRVRAQLIPRHGGTDDAKLLAVVTIKGSSGERLYRSPISQDLKAFSKVKAYVQKRRLNDKEFRLMFPGEEIPLMSGTFNVPIYGISRWEDLFNSRQKLSIVLLGLKIKEYFLSAKDENKKTVAILLAFTLDKFIRHCNGNARWNNVIESVEPAFGMQALSMTWTYPESIPWGPWAENWSGSLEAVAKCIREGFVGINHTGQVQLADATKSPLPDSTVDVWFTDPPYYYAVPYADLSDFFFVWLKRILPKHPLLRDPFNEKNDLTPKDNEICQMAFWDEKRYANKTADFFETKMADVFLEGRRILKDTGVGCVVFAHKTTEGWEALLSGLIKGGWTITASWPIATERSGRIRARQSAALATSIHLICRPRPENAEIGDWGTVLNKLPKRVADWMEKLQTEGVRGADLVFACIGPALEIFSRYSKVETAEGKEVTLAEYLEKVWEVVGRIALEHVLGTAEAKVRNGASGALEEDARLTALFLWTMQSTNTTSEEATNDINEVEETENDEEETTTKKETTGYSLIYDVARRFAQPLGIHLENWEGRIIEIEKGIVRLLSIKERAEQLFGRDGAEVIAADLISSREPNPQLNLFPESAIEASAEIRVKGKGAKKQKANTRPSEEEKRKQEATTLDRVHAAMLFQSKGQANALRKLLKAEQDRGSDFLRLANALSALYPKLSEEKRLIDAMILAVPK